MYKTGVSTMNEQTKELAMKYANKMGNSVLHNAEHLEEFAELIVKECADYFSREGDRRFEVDGNWIAKTIKQHFGV
jgi:hypothetical protein